MILARTTLCCVGAWVAVGAIERRGVPTTGTLYNRCPPATLLAPLAGRSRGRPSRDDQQHVIVALFENRRGHTALATC
jgi:hypothetical protein